jgi:hypothetical protein
MISFSLLFPALFLSQMKRNKSLLPFSLNAELQKYTEDGVLVLLLKRENMKTLHFTRDSSITDVTEQYLSPLSTSGKMFIPYI